MSVAEYVVVGIGIGIIFLIYGCIYIMTSEKEKNHKSRVFSFVSGLIEPWGKEKCVICGNPTAYAKKTPIIKRKAGYIESAGQLCDQCNYNIYL